VLLEESSDDSIFPSGSSLTELITFLFFILVVVEDPSLVAFLQLLHNKARADKKVKAI